MAEGDHHHGAALVKIQKMVMGGERAPEKLAKAEVGVLKNVAKAGEEVREGHSRISEDLGPFLALRETGGGLGRKLRFVGWEVVVPPGVLMHLGSSGVKAAELQRLLQHLVGSKPP